VLIPHDSGVVRLFSRQLEHVVPILLLPVFFAFTRHSVPLLPFLRIKYRIGLPEQSEKVCLRVGEIEHERPLSGHEQQWSRL
jgi:hypothetical protein